MTTVSSAARLGLAVTALALAAAPLSVGDAAATPPPPSPVSGSTSVNASVEDLSAGSVVTGPQYFEVRDTFTQSYFIFYPAGGPTSWQHLVRIPSLEAARPGAATYAVLGVPLPEDFILGTEHGVGVVATNPRRYGDPAMYGDMQTADVARDRLRATPQLPLPGRPNTVSLAVTLPGAAAGSVGFSGAPAGSLAPIHDAVGSLDLVGSIPMSAWSSLESGSDAVGS